MTLILLTFLPTITSADQATDDYLSAAKLYSKGRYELAADSFRSYLSKNPKHNKVGVAQLYLGNALIHLDQRREARDVLRKFVRQFPRNKNEADALYRIAECSYFMNDIRNAETEFQAFLKKSPRHEYIEWALPYLGDTQLRLNNPKSAKRHFERSLKLFPKSRMAEDAKFGLAKSLEMMKQPNDAIKIYQELSKNRRGERTPQAMINLATIYFDQKNYKNAITVYQTLIKQFPKDDLVPLAYLNTGYAEYQQQQYAKAISAFEQAALQKDQKETADYWKGLCYKSSGKYADASKTFSQLLATNSKTPFAEDVMYEWADCELRLQHNKEAKELFLRVVAKYPKSSTAGASLHLAGEAAFLLGELKESEKLVNQFARDYPKSAMRMHHKILHGRLLTIKGTKQNLDDATKLFETVSQKSSIPRTRSLAQFYLAGVLQKQKKDKQAIQAIASLIKQAKKEDANYEFVDAFVLSGNSLLNLKKYKEANSLMEEYLKRQPKGELADQALAVRAISEAQLGEKEAAHSLLSNLTTNYPQSKLISSTTQHLAEYAYDKKDYAWSTQLFQQIVDKGEETTFHAVALSGLGWSQFDDKKFREAAKTFALFVKVHPSDPQLASEAAFMQGRSFKEAGQLNTAATTFAAAFKKFAPAKTASPGAEKKAPTRYIYLSGLQAARMYRDQKQIKQADAAYEALLKKFPQTDSLDKLLDEWALLNYEAEHFDRADEIFRRLVKERPKSDLADNALLSLAESDLMAGNLKVAKSLFTKLKTHQQADETVREVALSHLVSIATEEEDWKGVKENGSTFIKLASKSPRASYVRFQYAEAMLHLNEFAEAQKSLEVLYANRETLLKQKTDWVPRIWVLLAELSINNKQYDDVAKYVEELRKQKDRPTYFYQAEEILGRMHIHNKNFDDAITVLQRVIDDKNAHRTETAAKSQFLIAECYLYQKDKNFKKAQKAYYRVYSLYEYPEVQSAALFQVGQCDEKLGKRKEALQSYEDLIKEFPKSKYVERAKKRIAALGG